MVGSGRGGYGAEAVRDPDGEGEGRIVSLRTMGLSLGWEQRRKPDRRSELVSGAGAGTLSAAWCVEGTDESYLLDREPLRAKGGRK